MAFRREMARDLKTRVLMRLCLLALLGLPVAVVTASCSSTDTASNPWPNGLPETDAGKTHADGSTSGDDDDDDDDDDASTGGGKGNKDSGPRPDANIGDGRRPLPPDVLARKAICYSGYRGTQSPDSQSYPSEAEIKEDLGLLARGKWTFLRLFDCSTHAERVLKVIKDNKLDFKVQQGIWIAGAKAEHDKENEDQIAACVTLINQYPDIVASISVGNENLDSWSDVRTPAPELADYIAEVRSQVTQPVGTDDLWPPFTLSTDDTFSYADVVQVFRAVDFLSVHIYPFIDAAPWDSWDWKQESTPAGHARAVAMMNASQAYAKDALQQVRDAITKSNLDIPIVLGEIGWKSKATNPTDNPAEPYMAHPVNQKMFYDFVQDWVYGAGKDDKSPLAAFYFEAFDEPWKGGDSGWGLFDETRQAKYVIWSTFPDKKPANAPTYSDNDAVYYK